MTTVPVQGKPKPQPLPRVCRHCGEDDLAELVHRARGIDRLCRTCARVLSREYRHADLAYFRNKQRAYRAADPEKYRAIDRDRQQRLVNQRVSSAWIGEMTKNWRQSNGLTIQQMADLIGIGRCAYSYRERGHRSFRPTELQRIAAIGIDLWADGGANHAS